jgi:Bacterial dnaA protein helix-turn-helix
MLCECCQREMVSWALQLPRWPTDKTPRPELFLRIIEAVAAEKKVTVREILSDSRMQRVAFARQLTMYLLREVAALSWPVLARHVNRDHSSAIHGWRTIARRMQQEPAFAALIRKLERQVRGNQEETNAVSEVPVLEVDSHR